MMGRPWQKCRTSEIHYSHTHVSALTFPQIVGHVSVPYLLLHVVKRVWRVDGETDEDDMRVWVRQRSKPIVVFLTSGIP